MQLFYDPDLREGVTDLRAAEAAHAARVLRKRTGDELALVDGRGGWFTAEILDISKRGCTISATAVRQEPQRSSHQLTLLVAPTKNIDRFEWILEKATEIGVDRIVPLLTEHSERKRIRRDRLERVLESAMKQSLRAWLPRLDDLTPFGEAISLPEGGQKLLAYLGDNQSHLLHNNYRPGADVCIAIGPEGGFSSREAEAARAAGFAYVSLGPYRLRTETAAITAVHTVEMMNWHG